MSLVELLGYIYGLRKEAQYQKAYYLNMGQKWQGIFTDKIDKLAKAYGWVCEEKILTELLKELIEDWWG